MDDWSVLDLRGDPTPGNPAEVQALAARFLRESEFAEQHTDRLRKVAANSGSLRMQGDYAPHFHQALGQLPEKSAGLGPAHRACGTALSKYAESLEQAKIQAGIALSRGVQADAQYRAALRQFNQLVPWRVPEGDIWRGLNGATAEYLSQYQQPEIRELAVQIGRHAGQAEQARQAARSMVLKAAQSKREAEAACAQAIRAAAPTGSGEKSQVLGVGVDFTAPGVSVGVVSAAETATGLGIAGAGHSITAYKNAHPNRANLSSPESDVGDKEPGSHFPPPGEGTKQLETLDESRLTKDADGLITQIDGKPVSSYLISLTETRAEQYRRACADKKNPLSKNALGDCIAVGVDRRTGRVYEGINGRRGSQMDPEDVHPTIRIRVDRVEQAGPYLDDNGEPNFAFPHPDIPLRHAEVKATNQALRDRRSLGLPDDESVMSEIMMNAHFVYTRGGEAARFCASCHNILGDVDSSSGRYSGWPPSDDLLIPGVTS